VLTLPAELLALIVEFAPLFSKRVWENLLGRDRAGKTLFVEQLPFFNVGSKHRPCKNSAIFIRALYRRALLCGLNGQSRANDLFNPRSG
jgi:hypothetical protein